MMKFLTNYALITFFLVTFCSFARCLYEDQVGKFDWRQQYVGGVTWVEFDHSSSTGKQLIVATKQNVLASLNSKNGHIGWRYIFEKGDSGRIDDVVQISGFVIAAMGGGEFVRCVNMGAGSLAWEVSITDACSSDRARLLEFGNDGVAVLSAGAVSVYEAGSGTPLWTKQLPSSDTVKYTELLKYEDSLVAVGVASTSHISIVMLTDDGVQISQGSIPAPWVEHNTRCQMLDTKMLICLDARLATLHTLDLSKSQEFRSTTLESLGLHGQQLSMLPKPLTDSSSAWGIVLQLGDSSAALVSVKNGMLQLERKLEGVTATLTVQHGEDPVLLTLSRSPSQNVELRGYDATTGQEMVEYYQDITFPIHHGSPKQLAGLVLQRRDGTTAVRVMVVSEDDSLVMLQHTGKVSWQREEAISSIVSVEMVDLPVSRIQAQMEEGFGNQADDILALFFKRFSSQFAQLQEFFVQLRLRLRGPRHQHMVQDEVEMETEEGEEEDDEEYLTRDSFNLHKMIVAATATGKIFGIDSLTGQVMWRHLLPNFGSFSRYGEDVMPLLVQRTTAHFPHTPVCSVIGAHRITGQTMLFTFNPISGAPVDGMPPGGQALSYTVVQLMMIPQMTDDFLHPIVLLDNNNEYHVHPAADAGLVRDLAPVLYMFTSDTDRALLKGYRMVVGDTQELRAEQLWTVNLQTGGQSIIRVLSKRPIEHVHSQGIVLGDRSVLYKYLNPNLILVATEGVDSSQKAFFNMYLIDAVSGHMVFHCTHKRAKGPTEIIHSENWVVYTYWNQKLRRNEIAVLELYEGKKQSNATAFSSLAPPPAPITMRQSYIFSAHVTAMAATITEKGITSKHILMALEMGGILDLPKMLLDPRRPIHPTQESREEGLMPYMPELPRPFESMINYNLTVNNIRGIHTAPAGLESTCLLLCYGLDLFYSHVTPSKMFDVLKDDFDYVFISSVLLAMITVSVVVRKLSARKALTKAWK